MAQKCTHYVKVDISQFPSKLSPMPNPLYCDLCLSLFSRSTKKPIKKHSRTAKQLKNATICLECYQILCKDHFTTHKDLHHIFLHCPQSKIVCRDCKMNLHVQSKDDSKLSELLLDILKALNISDEVSDAPYDEEPLDPPIKPVPLPLEEEKVAVAEPVLIKEDPIKTYATPVVGLKNIGNTCYLNAVLQCLNASSDFVSIITSKTTGRGFLEQRFSKFLVSMQQGREESYDPKEVLEAIRIVCKKFEGYKQQDAFEFLLCLLDRLLIEEQGSISEFLAFPLSKLCGSYLVNKVQCLKCGETVWRLDPCVVYSIPIGRPDIEKDYGKKGGAKKDPPVKEKPAIKYEDLKIVDENISGYRKAVINSKTYYEPEKKLPKSKREQDIKTLDECLRHFFSKEVLCMENNNSYNCPKCGTETMVREFFIAQPPKMLMIQLKRFIASGSGFIKNEKRVFVPLELVLDNFVILPENEFAGKSGIEKKSGKAFKYSLYSVVVHTGELNSGHYTAYVKNNNKWYYTSDTYWYEVSAESVLMAEAYIVFYQLCP